jgi:chromosome segregation ATPase
MEQRDIQKIVYDKRLNEMHEKLKLANSENSEEAKAEREKADQESKQLRDEVQEKDNKLESFKEQIETLKKEYEENVKQTQLHESEVIKQEEEKMSSQIKTISADLANEIATKQDFQDKYEKVKIELEKLKKSIKTIEEDTGVEVEQYRKEIEEQKNTYLEQIDQARENQDKIEEENRKMTIELLTFKGCQETLSGKSKSLEEKLRVIQDRYDTRYKSQEDEIVKLSIENTSTRQENEMMTIELSDLQFRVTRSEHNEQVLQERMANTNADHEASLKNMEIYHHKIVGLREEIEKLTDEK